MVFYDTTNCMRMLQEREKNLSLPRQKAAKPVLKQIPRGAILLPTAGGAEIKPVEPDQGNACAGKEDFLFPSFRFAAFPSQFLTVKNRR